ncbi:MAG: DUF2283 domain-containing protein [Anaerolineales bacterium]|nr:DUF2283 domain-containing protein [Anaerolineales bacterium]MCB9435350.1 DUF2283 domain-containing protein [Ardenticatenaceae bacterium]
MRVIYDKQTDTLTIIFKEGKVLESDEEKPGVILDYDDLGNIVSMEILDASQRIQQPHQMVYELAGLEQ